MSAYGPRYLIVRLGSLGDVIHGIPVAAALRAHYPEARIDWMVDPAYVELLSLVPAVDRCVALDPRARRAAVIGTIRELRRRRYAVAFDLQGLLKSAVLARLAGAGRTVGFSRPHLREPLARGFYTQTVDVPASGHVIGKNLALLTAIGVSAEAKEFPLVVRRTPVMGIIDNEFDGHGYAVMNIGAAWPNKRWPPEQFGALAAALRDRTGLRSLVLWGPGEEAIAAAAAAASSGAATAAPATTITDVCVIMASARLVVAGDTGPLHIAAAVGAPIVGLFGPTSAERTGPWSPRDVVVSRFEQCSCSYQRTCSAGARCIDSIAVTEVVAAAERRLGLAQQP
ncbi:MAG TPA: lipopolysaccharide heptosyltransferase I [Vicinamibacterales bacterium]|nr:lipopolysaccharide heptosyltransferase I [Vicinamibacterales bacterium]